MKNLPLLFFSRTLAGFTGGNISIAMSCIADLSDERAKAKNFGLIGMAFGLGFMLGPFIGGKLADSSIVSWFNFSTPFWFAAALSAFNILLVVWRFRETLAVKIHRQLSLLTGFRNIGRAFQLGNLRTMFLVIFLFTLGFSFFTQFFQVYLVEKFHFTQSDIGNVFGYTGIWIAFTQGFITRVLSHKIQPAQVLKFSIFGLGLSLFALLLPDKPVWLFFILPFVALTNGLTQPNSTAVVSNLSARDSQGEILGIQQSIQSLGIALPAVISGFIFSINPNLPNLVGGSLMLAAWLIFLIFFKTKKAEVFHEV